MEITNIWQKYREGVAHHQNINLYAETERNWNFFVGEQWKGINLKNKNYTPPSENIIKPIVKNLYSTVAMQKRSVIFSDMSHNGVYADIIQSLNELAQQEWEKGKIDTLMWQVIKRSAITGDSYIYVYENRATEQGVVPNLKPEIKHQIIHNTNIYFADEKNSNINEQEYIIISERLPVNKVKKIAKAKGLSEDLVEEIVADENLEEDVSVNSFRKENNQCTSLLYFEKTDSGIKYCRSTATVVYDEGIIPIDVYPITMMKWEETIGQLRGVSAVKNLIPNQCSINYTLYRIEQSVKRTAFPQKVYDVNALQNAEKLDEIGSSIAVDSLADRPVNTLVSYLNPAHISNDAQTFLNELIQFTRELAGAGEAATGQVDPTKTSGEAIKAARDAAALPLNEQISYQLEMIEDLARIWYKMWVAYSVNGLEVTIETEDGEQNIVINQDVLKDIEPSIKIDISPIDPYSVLAEDNNLLAMLGKHISFEEFVEALPENTNLPKIKFEKIIKNRQLQNELSPEMPMEEMGGVENEMPAL